MKCSSLLDFLGESTKSLRALKKRKGHVEKNMHESTSQKHRTSTTTIQYPIIGHVGPFG